ncbi:type II secretion system secretin GspD [Geopsychrobacter electrodiphilus]|uniref:type II secretion system secretin GspD n=1 Tax=Geopsychrobacter electrodiphilus TaxID=225196 RepID=UPI0003AA93CC|nr:type II secretion system secretin GspD [Geopsychrobacter electrodiphilus]
MMNYLRKFLLVSALATLFTGALFFQVSQARAQSPKAEISLDFKDVELSDLIKTISEMTGRNFVYDERVRGKVTIISPEPMSRDEAYQLFMTVLNVKGYTLIETGKVNKIVPLQDAKQNNLPVSDTMQGDGYITRLIRLNYADAQVLASTVLLPLIAKTSNLTVYEPTNTLILTDNAANIDRLVEIIDKLDLPSALDRLEVFTLKDASAEEIAQIANSMISKQTNPRRRRVVGNAPTQTGQVIAYPRTNTLLAIASEDELNLLRSLIATLDVPGEQTRSNINVYYLKNADAETLAKTLNEIMTGTKTAAASKKPGVTTPSGPVVITADKPTNSLLISAGPDQFAEIKQVIEKLDIQRNQVYVEALILELSMDATRAIGASLQGAAGIGKNNLTLGTSNLNSGSVGLSSFVPTDGSTIPLLAQTVQGLMLGGLFSPITTVGADGTTITVPAISALIQLSQTSKDINILSAPRLLTSDNEEAEIIVGSNVPIITNRLTDTSNTSAQSVAIERKDVALTLRFTPQVTEGNLVRLNVYQEITAIAGTQVGNVNDVGPTFTKRQLRNTVLAEDGKTVVLGGLIGTNVQKTESKVPFFGDIPLIGWLFRSTGTTSEKTNLLVFITPRVIHNATEMSEVTRRAQLTGEVLQSPALRKAIDQKSLLIKADTDVDSTPQEAPAKNE